MKNTNKLLLQALASSLVYPVARLVVDSHSGTHSTFVSSQMPSLMAALLFATHPVHTEAVSNVRQFKEAILCC
jgi:hypothetical protein